MKKKYVFYVGTYKTEGVCFPDRPASVFVNLKSSTFRPRREEAPSGRLDQECVCVCKIGNLVVDLATPVANPASLRAHHQSMGETLET